MKPCVPDQQSSDLVKVEVDDEDEEEYKSGMKRRDTLSEIYMPKSVDPFYIVSGGGGVDSIHLFLRIISKAKTIYFHGCLTDTKSLDNGHPCKLGKLAKFYDAKNIFFKNLLFLLFLQVKRG